MKILKSLGLILLGALILPITLLANNFFNSSKVDYVVKEEINFNKVDLITSRNDYVFDHDDFYKFAASITGVSQYYNSFINVSDECVIALMGTTTEFVDEFKFSNDYTNDLEFIVVFSKNKLVDVSFDNKIDNYFVSSFLIDGTSPVELLINFGSNGYGYSIDEIMPEECWTNLIDKEEYWKMDDEEIEEFDDSIYCYLFTLGKFDYEIKEEYKYVSDYSKIEDYDVLQTMTLTFLHD